MVTFDPSTGAPTSTTFGLGLQGAVPDSAVGADGSLYITHEDGSAGAHAPTFVSRVSPSGDVLWTSVDLWTLIPPTTNPAGIEPSLVALAKDDLVVIAIQTPDDGNVVNAFDPTTGATRWSTTFNGALKGGPAIRPDGTIALLITTNLVLLDPETGAATATHPLPGAGAGIWAVTKGGALIMGIMPPDLAVLTAAVDGEGTPLWTSQVLGNATLASDGTIVVFGITTITALDGETGATKWELQAPSGPNACFIDGALTSEGGIMALACDGTLLGASD
jgi:outer membrane protein assembly factor BamB